MTMTEKFEIKKEEEAQLNDLMGTRYLTQVKLCQKMSKEVDQGMSPGTWIKGYGDTAEDIGREVVCIPLAWRPHALQLAEDNSVKAESFNQQSPDFKSIRIEADRGGQGNKAMYGVDFLLYLPNHEEFVVYFCNKTARQTGIPGLTKAMGKTVVLTSFLHEGKKHSWYKPRVDDFTGDQVTVDGDKLLEVKKAFDSPLGGDVQEAETELNR